MIWQRAGEAAPVTEQEKALRDALTGFMQDNGLDVVTDTAEGQKIVDAVNGRVRLSRGQKRAVETASLTPKGGSRADISTADSAKVANNLDTLAENIEKVSKNRKNFLEEVAKALNAEQYGSGSKYATFDTKSGRACERGDG